MITAQVIFKKEWCLGMIEEFKDFVCQDTQGCPKSRLGYIRYYKTKQLLNLV